MYCRVALLSPPYSTLTYACPEWLPIHVWQPGLRVAAPLGHGALRACIVLELIEQPNVPAGINIKPLVWPLEAEPLLSASYLEMGRQLAFRQLVSEGKIFGSLLPLGLRTTVGLKVRCLEQGQTKAKIVPLRKLQHLPKPELFALGQGFINGCVDMPGLRQDMALSELCCLNQDPPWKIRPNAFQQKAVLDYLLQNGKASRRRLLQDVPDCGQALSSLVSKGFITLLSQAQCDALDDVRIESVRSQSAPHFVKPNCVVGSSEALGLGDELDDCGEDGHGLQFDENDPAFPAREVEKLSQDFLPPSSAPFCLSDAQIQALETLKAALHSGSGSSHLLFGVTGSGKTAVFLELVRSCLESGRSAMLLAPEVALALKLRRDVQERYPQAPLFLFHGYQSPGKREQLFTALAQRKEPCIIVGTRSALFLPVSKLGAIVLDEEHDASFKQDERFLYQAKEVAWFRASQEKALLLLASATPDLKTFYAAQQGSLPTSRLPQRVGGGTMPEIQLVNIKDSATASLLSPASIDELKNVIKAGNQAIVLLNRRGYAPRMFCLDCGLVAKCPHCDIALTYHKAREQLVCHYCGHTKSFPSPCGNCKGMHYLPMGEGTEKLEEDLQPLLEAGGKILRLDRDSTRRPGRMEEILATFARQEAQILVGTQMLSKGHHFPNVTLAVVADGDLGLNIPDYRAAERTFQLLLQSAGRAGRGVKAGTVLIQSRDTRHYCWDFVGKADYEGFYQHEIALREKRRYPPFVKLALVRFSYPMDSEICKNQVAEISKQLKQRGRELGVNVLGPAPAPLARLQGRIRVHCLLKSENWQDLRTLYAKSVPNNFPTDLRISLDLDPVNML